jgi:hypothetical protein
LLNLGLGPGQEPPQLAAFFQATFGVCLERTHLVRQNLATPDRLLQQLLQMLNVEVESLDFPFTLGGLARQLENALSGFAHEFRLSIRQPFQGRGVSESVLQ